MESASVCEWCGKPLPSRSSAGRSARFCSPRCRKEAGRSGRTRPSAAARRTCLKCGEPFLSEGPWNRLCRRCCRENERLAEELAPMALRPRARLRHRAALVLLAAENHPDGD